MAQTQIMKVVLYNVTMQQKIAEETRMMMMMMMIMNHLQLPLQFLQHQIIHFFHHIRL